MGGLRGAFVLSMAAAIGFAGTAQAASPPGLNARAQAQIAALQRIKESASPAEAKLDSRLLVALRQRASRRATAALPALRTGVKVARAGTTEVSIQAPASRVPRLRKLGANVRAVARR